jgi:hypothetical protein
MAKLKNVNELKFTKIMSEQEIIIRKSAELKLMVGLALSLEECETFIKDVLEAQQQVNVTLGSVSKCQHPYKKVISGDDGMWCTECNKYITTF